MKNSVISIAFASIMIGAIVFVFVESVNAGTNPEQKSTVAPMELSTVVQTGQRPKVFFNTLLTGGFLHEDENNRFTDREYTGLLTPGLVLRVGGVIQNHHLLGVRFHGTWRSTQAVLDSEGGDNAWGAVSSYYIGPSYRYQTQSGFYFGLSSGVSFVLVDNRVGDGEGPECDADWCVEEHFRNSDDSGFIGLSVMGTIGYEHRINRYFSLTVEGYWGAHMGQDENDRETSIGYYGIGFGIGI